MANKHTISDLYQMQALPLSAKIRFTLYTWEGTNVKRTVIEVEEKPKTYIYKKQYCSSRILKSDVGMLSGYDNNTLYMLEDNMEKAKSIFAESLKGKIEREKLKIENTIKCCNERIAKYENGITELLKGEEG